MTRSQLAPVALVVGCALGCVALLDLVAYLGFLDTVVAVQPWPN
jgi:hypothetical protein